MNTKKPRVIRGFFSAWNLIIVVVVSTLQCRAIIVGLIILAGLVGG